MAIKSVDVMVREKMERDCFGTTLDAFKKKNACSTDFKSPEDLLMLSTSIQSDCQELIERLPGDMVTGRDQLRHWLNISKWCINEAGRLIRVREAEWSEYSEDLRRRLGDD